MKVINFFRNLLFIVAVAVLISTAACLVLRLKPAAVLSGSMEPTFHTGSIVLISRDKEVTVGDAAAFYVGDERMYVTHRIVGVGTNGYITKGDANMDEDPWQVAESDIDGKVLFSVPYLGYLFKTASSKPGIIMAGAIILCLLLSLCLSGKEEAHEEEQ